MSTASALDGLGPMRRKDSMAAQMMVMFKKPNTHTAFLTSSQFAHDLIQVRQVDVVNVSTLMLLLLKAFLSLENETKTRFKMNAPNSSPLQLFTPTHLTSGVWGRVNQLFQGKTKRGDGTAMAVVVRP